MRNRTITTSQWYRMALTFGLLSVAAYFLSVVTHYLPTGLSRILFFSIGPLSIISVFAFYRVISEQGDSIALQLGTLFHIIAGVVLNMMAVVQATQFTTLGKQINEAADVGQKELLTEILWGVNVVQSGLDISWDIFISIGTFMLGYALVFNSNYGKLIGTAGMVISFAALGLNLATFPTAPSEYGLIDLGPGIGLWYAVILYLLWRSFQLNEVMNTPSDLAS